MALLTKATVTSNGFTYGLTGMLGKEKKSFEVHLGSRYGTEIKEISDQELNAKFQRRVDRLEAARVKREFTALILEAREL